MLSRLITGCDSSAATASDESLAEGVVDRVEHDDAARRRAALPGVRERRREHPLDRAVEIGVVADDERVLPAELETRLRESARCGLVDRAAGRGRAGEAHEVDVRMVDERRARLGAEPVHDVEHAGRDARLERELGEERRRRRRVLRRLHDRGVPAEDRRERLPGDVRKRRVEAHDQRRDAERLAQRQHRAVRHARRRRAPVRASSLARDEEPHLDGGVRLAERELERLARLLCDDRRGFLAPLAEKQRERRARCRRARRRSARPTPAAPRAPPRPRPPRPRRRSARRGRAPSRRPAGSSRATRRSEPARAARR